AEIAAMVAEEALFDLDAPIRRLAGPDVPAMGYAITLEEEFMIPTHRMRDAMRELVQF
ncbi:MAG: alpha-ketoacid dehydrogenase subunit beta, partial [Candidatus Eremiobacteraeota bacterium]|nr:alpha-ketoacid dehydrogenase subunit beta [Candidatus Eremiobacteraeota bacterium]